MTPAEMKKLVDSLAKRLKYLEKDYLCPICKAKKWVVGNDITQVTFQPTPGAFVLGGPCIPAVIMICSACGFLALHASKLLEKDPNVTEMEIG